MEISVKDEWNGLLAENQYIYIYGAGKIGKKILNRIKAGGQQCKVKGFLVSDKSGNPATIENIPVFQIDESEFGDGLILLSVADTYQDEILALLKNLGYTNVVCAYRFSFFDTDENRMGGTGTIDTRELLVQQYSNGAFNRLDIIVRLLAVENYYHVNDFGFQLYKKMQEIRVREGYSVWAVQRFENLIKSFGEKGYENTSEIIVDENLKLMDGSHRLALAIYHGIDRVTIKIEKNVQNIDYGMEWFRKYFDSVENEILKQKFYEVSEKWIIPIKGIIWPNAMKYKEEITQLIAQRHEVLTYRDYNFPKEIFERFVWGVYHTDDMAEWKINSKLKHFMQADSFQVRVLDIKIEYPDFRMKDMGTTISQSGEALKKDVRKSFKDRVDHYYYDIIFHTADNYYQSRYLEALLPDLFSLRPFFYRIRDLNWMLIKTENDYYPSDFPDSYAIYKDIDVITTKQDVAEIKDQALLFLQQYRKGIYQVRELKKAGGYLLRFELEGFLIFQIDISYANEYFSEYFFKQSLENKIRKDGYCVPEKKDECMYRFADFMKCPEKKKKHLEYIINCFIE